MFLRNLFFLSALLTIPVYAQPVILENIPDVRQSTEYSCGAAAFQAVLSYWGNQDYIEADLMKMLKTSCDTGTMMPDMIRVARELKLEAELRRNLALQDLEKYIDQKIPVIICAQAWRTGEDAEKPWKDIWSAGHFMVVVGYDQENVYLEDPWLLGSIAFIPREEFMDRWHCKDGETPEKQEPVFHMGVIIKGEKSVTQPKLYRLE